MASTRKAIEKAGAAMQAGDFGKAEQILAKVNAEPNQRNLPSLLLYSHALEAQQKISPAVAALEAAETRAREPWEKVKILNKAADLLCGRHPAPDEHVRKAIGFLERSVALDPRPGNAMSRKNLCALYYRLQYYEAVERHAEILVEVPKFAMKANLWLASTGFFLGHKKRGEPRLLEAATGAADLDDGDLTWLLEMLMNYRCHSQAQQIIDAATAAGSGLPVLSRVQAHLYYEAGEYERVLDILTDDFARSSSGEAKSNQSFFFRGRSLDALGRYAEAHDCFVAMNAAARQAYPAPVAKDLAAAYAEVDLAGLPEYELPESAPYVPAFMVAFPRSGTTLLDTILDTQDEITTLSETEGVLAARQAMTEMGHDYPEDLSLLSRQEVNRMRDTYFAYNAHFLEPDDSFQLK